MPKRCKPCLGADIKAAILREVRPGIDLEKVPDCADPVGIELCGKVGRAANPYSLFIGQCLREAKVKSFADAPAKMRECARAWRNRPK